MSKQYSAPPPMTIDVNKTYVAHLETSRGEIEVELFHTEVPKTVNNFVFLARDGFYDGTIFHRVIQNFMIHGVDPSGTGRWGPVTCLKTKLKAIRTSTAWVRCRWPMPVRTRTA